MRLEELQEIARKLTFSALEAFVIPEEYRSVMTLGVFFEGDVRVFELYVPGEQPKDAKVISRARIDCRTGEGSVEVFGLTLKPSSPPTPDSARSTPRG
jgi:hypothetical protein